MYLVLKAALYSRNLIIILFPKRGNWDTKSLPKATQLVRRPCPRVWPWPSRTYNLPLCWSLKGRVASNLWLAILMLKKSMICVRVRIISMATLPQSHSETDFWLLDTCWRKNKKLASELISASGSHSLLSIGMTWRILLKCRPSACPLWLVYQLPRLTLQGDDRWLTRKYNYCDL